MDIYISAHGCPPRLYGPYGRSSNPVRSIWHVWPRGAPGSARARSRSSPLPLALCQLARIMSRVETPWRPSPHGELASSDHGSASLCELASIPSRDARRRRLGLAGSGVSPHVSPPSPCACLISPFGRPAPKSHPTANWPPPPPPAGRHPRGAPTPAPRSTDQGVGRSRGKSQRPTRHPATAAPPQGPLHWPHAVTPARPMPVGPPATLRLSGRLPGQWTGPVRLYTYSPTRVGRTDAMQSFPRGKCAARGRVNYGGGTCTTPSPIQSGPPFYASRPPSCGLGEIQRRFNVGSRARLALRTGPTSPPRAVHLPKGRRPTGELYTTCAPPSPSSATLLSSTTRPAVPPPSLRAGFANPGTSAATVKTPKANTSTGEPPSTLGTGPRGPPRHHPSKRPALPDPLMGRY